MEHRKHHYVPVCYLKNFTYDSNSSVHVFLKQTGEQFSKKVSEICFINNFYRLSEDYINQQEDKSVDELSLELYFATQIESEYNQLLELLTKEADNAFKNGCTRIKLSKNTKFALARNIAIQKLRMPDIRSQIVENECYVAEKATRLFKQGLSKELNIPSMKNLPIGVTIDEVLLHANETFLDEQQVGILAYHLTNCYWHFYYSSTEEFYTSDNPVTIENRADDSYEQHFGLTNKGVEVSIPINPRLLLSIYDYRYYSLYKESDGLFAEAQKDHIQCKNLCQYLHSSRFLINKTGDFSVAIKAKEYYDNMTKKHN